MPATPRRINARRLPALAGFAVLAVVAVAPGQDTVILRDGTVLKGRPFKPKESIFDKTSGMHVVVDKALGLDGIDTGLKYVFFSSHNRQVAETVKEEKTEASGTTYERKALIKSAHDVPPGFGEILTTPWDKNWRRTKTIKFNTGGFETIEQAIWHIDPYVVRIVSVTHKEGMAFATTEWGPKELLDLLSLHPDLVEEPGKPDVLKRLRKVEFLKEVGLNNPVWLTLARNELDKVKKGRARAVDEGGERTVRQLKAEMGKAEAKAVHGRVEKAMQAGRYNFARSFLNRIDPAQADAAALAKATELRPASKPSGRGSTGSKLLLELVLDELTGASASRPRVGGRQVRSGSLR